MKPAALRSASRFALLAMALSWPVFLAVDGWLLPQAAGRLDAASLAGLGLLGHLLAMAGPAIAALILWRRHPAPARPAWRWGRPADYLWLALGLLALRAGTLLVGGAVEPGTLHWRSAIEPGVGVILLGSLTVGWLAGLGEEVGWCAYLLPGLTPAFGRVGAVVIAGVIRGLWHLPLLLLPLQSALGRGELTPAAAVASGLAAPLALALSNVLFGALLGWLWFKRESIPLAGWAHQWHDLARDAGLVLVIGAASSPTTALTWSVAIHALGLVALWGIHRARRLPSPTPQVNPRRVKAHVHLLAIAGFAVVLAACAGPSAVTPGPSAPSTAGPATQPAVTPDARATPPASPRPSPAPTATDSTPSLPPAGWQTYRETRLGFTLAYPPAWEVAQETGQSRLFSLRHTEPTGPSFPPFYVTVLPEGFTNEGAEAYNFWSRAEIAAALALEVGETGAIHGPPDYDRYTRLPDTTVDGVAGVVVEAARVWEGAPGTRDRRVLLRRGSTLFMLGAYYETPEELHTFEQALATFAFLQPSAAATPPAAGLSPASALRRPARPSTYEGYRAKNSRRNCAYSSGCARYGMCPTPDSV